LSQAGDKYAKLAPVVAMVMSGLLALDQTDERLNTTAFTSVKAGVASALAVEGSKFLIGRSRPEAGNGSSDFHTLDSGNGNTSFPSGHTAVMWAALTPYAKEYEMPWLYGVAALTNIGRVAGREHWFSDTVGGAFLGYAVGSLMWESQRKTAKQGAEWMISPSGVAFSWKTD
jgi:membrane-associated phospholipid phosphatase